MLQTAEAKNSTVRESEDTNEKRVIIGSQECLLSSSDKGNERLAKSLRDKLDSLSGEGLERIVEVDITVVLELLDESLEVRGNAGCNVAPVDNEKHRSCVDYI